jgi:hypothetical protein
VRLLDPERQLLHSAKYRAKKQGLPFSITRDDIKIPALCPALGIPLVVHRRAHGPDSPSVDRLIPALGYVKGNIAVISHFANQVKLNATPEQLMRIALWTQSVHAAARAGHE